MTGSHRPMRPLALLLTLLLPLAAVPPAAAADAGLMPASTTAGESGRRIAGSGRVVDDVRPVPSFTAVRISGPIDVVLRPGDREQVTVHFDDNLLAQVETRVAGLNPPTLEIQLAPAAAFRSSDTPRVTVEFKALSSLTLRGSGDVKVTGLRAPMLAVAMAGSGDMRLEQIDVDALGVSIAGSGDFNASGRAAEQGFRIAGSGDVNAGNLVGQVVRVRIAGSGDAVVHAEQTLEASVAGSGDVVYRGNPVVRKSVAGSGEVRRAH